MRKITVVRFFEGDDRTLSVVTVFDGQQPLGQLWALELPWKNNAREISRIPAGRYRVTPEHATLGRPPKNQFVLRVHDVPNRSGILVHAGNQPSHTLGCLLMGVDLADLNADAKLDTSRSVAAMQILEHLITTEAIMVVADLI